MRRIQGTGRSGPEPLSRRGNAPSQSTGRVENASTFESASEVSFTNELQSLITRVRSADTFRKERVHQVLEKMQRGELITSETVREAAERILRGGP